jgi:hypothetical protein
MPLSVRLPFVGAASGFERLDPLAVVSVNTDAAILVALTGEFALPDSLVSAIESSAECAPARATTAYIIQ